MVSLLMVNKIDREKNDLFHYKITRFLFKNKVFLIVFKIALFALFLYALFHAIFYPYRENHIALALFWSLFWPFFMVLSLATFGRVFCGICPHGFMGKYISKIGLKKETPKWMRKPLIGVAGLLLSYWAMLYLFHDLLDNAFITGIFFLLFTLFAVIAFFVFKDMAYCKYFCPIGSITAHFSKTGFTWLATYKSACSSCKDFACAKACPYALSPFNFNKKQSMSDCTLCMDCTHACEAVGFFVTKPAFSLIEYKKSDSLTGVWTFILITIVALISMSFYNALGNSPLSDYMPWTILAEPFEKQNFNVKGLFTVLFAAIFTLAFTMGSYYIVAKRYGYAFNTVAKITAYSLAPLVLFGGLAQTLPFFLTTYAPNFVSAFLSLGGDGIVVASFVEKSNPILRVFALLHFFAFGFASFILYKRSAYFKKDRFKIFLILSSFNFAYLFLILFIMYSYVFY